MAMGESEGKEEAKFQEDECKFTGRKQKFLTWTLTNAFVDFEVDIICR